jgi:hypothetical protein
MPRAIALRSFDHYGPVKKGQEVSFDKVTMDALRRSGLVGKDIDGEGETVKTQAPQAPVPTVGSLGKAPQPKVKDKVPKAPRAGKKSSASPAAPASAVPTLPPFDPGSLPPPLPGE